MKKRFLFLFFFLIQGLYAQLYPVQVNSVLVPPYLATISSYSTTMNEKFMVQLYVNDLTLTRRQVQLKLYIEGNGIKATSAPFIEGATPLFVSGGETLQLNQMDLAPYFKLQNLQGITPTQYSKTLPQGMYSFCAELYDFYTQEKIAKKSCAMGYFMVNSPPLLNLPANHQSLDGQTVQNIFFSWTPRHVNAGNVEYEFTLVELLDPMMPAGSGFFVSRPLYQTTTLTPTLLYGMSEPLLIPGRKYAWRVQARTTSGFGDGASFENNGYSEIYDFTFKGNCDKPQFVIAEPKTNTQVKVSWQQNPNHTHYLMQTRKKGTTEWFEGEGDQPMANINDLEAGQSYEFRVGAYCVDNVLSFSPIIDFTMPAKKSKDFQCGLEPNLDLSNQTPYSGTLNKGQEFMAGDFAVRVLEASGNGTFTGKGWITVPFLGPMRIAVNFQDIQLNTDLQLMAGEVNTTYDPEWKNVLDINQTIADVKEFANEVTQLYDNIKDFLNNYKGTEEDKKKAEEFEKDLNQNIQELLDNLNISAEDKSKLVQSQNDNKEHWDALKTGKDCGEKAKSNGNGPNGVAYYNLEADFDCHTKPATEQAETVNTIAADAVKKGCTMPAMVRGCPDGTLENPLNDGNWQTVIALLNDLKKAIINKTSYTYTKNLNLDTGSQVSIGKTCFDPIYYDYSSMTVNSKKVNTVSYTKEITKSYSGSDYWTLKFDEVLWIKIPKVVQAGKDISKTKIDYLEQWLLCGKEEDAVATTTQPPAVPLNTKILQEVFKDTDPKRLAEVAAVINKFSDKFEINTPLRMSHFLAQIGAETGGLNDLDEKTDYSPRRVVELFGFPKYADLFQGYNSDPNKCMDVSFEDDGGTLGDGRPGDVSPVFTYSNKSEIIIAYSYPKQGVTSTNIQDLVYKSYNAGKLKVKEKYYGDDAKLFDVTYACRMGNRGPASGDGSKFKGKGFIHLTGRWQYKNVSNEWNKKYPNDKKEFHGKDIDLLSSDIEIAIKASLIYWENSNLNKIADKDDVDRLSASVNGTNPANQIGKRREYLKNFKKEIK